MKTVYIDFTDIGDYEDFYTQLKEKIQLPDHFGDNLDALFDTITGDLEMPLHLEFVNMTVDQLEIFEDLLTTLEDAEEEVEDFEGPINWIIHQVTYYNKDVKDQLAAFAKYRLGACPRARRNTLVNALGLL